MIPFIARLAAKSLFILSLSLVVMGSSGCAKQQDGEEQRLSRANDYVATGKYVEAEKEYQDILRIAPENPVAVRRLALLYYEQGQFAQAYPLLKKAAELHPDDVDVHLKLGLTLLGAREVSQARETALGVLKKEPSNEQALLLLVDTAAGPDEIAQTRQRVLSLRDQDQDRSGYRLALGVLDLRDRQHARAESEFKAALQLNPKSLIGYTALANFYWSRKDFKAAEQAFKTAADLDPLYYPIRLRYAEFLHGTGSVTAAQNIVEDINRRTPGYLPARVYLMKTACAELRDENCAARVENVLTQDPVNYEALFQRGLLNLQNGESAEAIRVFAHLSNMYRNPQALYQLARAYLLNAQQNSGVANRRNAQESAELSLSEALKLDANFDQAALLLAEIRIRKGSFAAAKDLLAPLTQKRPPVPQAHSLLASAYLAEQKRDEALAVYRQMAELFPQDPQPPYLMGIMLLDRKQLAEARAAFEKSTDISADYLPAIEKLVDLEIAEKQHATALKRVQRIIDKDPNVALPWALKAKVHFAQRDVTQAELDLLKAITLDPNLEGAYVLLAQLYVSTGRPEQAIEKLNTFVEKKKTVATLAQLGMIQQNLKHFSAARDTYEKLLTVNPNFAPALNNLAFLYAENLGQLDTAYDLAKKAKDLFPNEPHTADTLGWILYHKGQYGDALRLLQESANKLPNDPEVQYHLGMAHYMLGDDVLAGVALQRASDASKDFPHMDEARRRLAMLAIEVGTANAADRKKLEDYLRETPNDPAALFRLAAFQERDGMIDHAIKTYEKILSGYPAFAPASRRLAILYSQRSTDDPKALEVATKARHAYPEDPEVVKALGILNYRRGLYPQTADLLRQAAAKRPEDSELLYYLGKSYQQIKQWNECKQVLQRALTLHLATAFADDAKTALTECSETAPL